MKSIAFMPRLHLHIERLAGENKRQDDACDEGADSSNSSDSEEERRMVARGLEPRTSCM